MVEIHQSTFYKHLLGKKFQSLPKDEKELANFFMSERVLVLNSNGELTQSHRQTLLLQSATSSL
jgi:hypothetical protein